MARIKTAGGARRNGAAQERARRKWSVDEKVRVVQELERSGAAVREVARRHGAHMSMVKRWRGQYRAGEFGAHRPMRRVNQDENRATIRMRILPPVDLSRREASRA